MRTQKYLYHQKYLLISQKYLSLQFWKWQVPGLDAFIFTEGYFLNKSPCIRNTVCEDENNDLKTIILKKL